MSYRLKWTCELAETDSKFNPSGAVHKFEGMGVIASAAPTHEDVVSATGQIASQIESQLGITIDVIAAHSTTAPRAEDGSAVTDAEGQEKLSEVEPAPEPTPEPEPPVVAEPAAEA